MNSNSKSILNWARKQPYWMQFALNCIFKEVELSESVLENIFTYFLEDTGLEKAPQDLIRPEVAFPLVSAEGPSFTNKLKAIKNLKNVNRLSTNQTLTLGDKLTIVYGGNGTGKTGYSRLVGSLAFTRGNTEVLPDLGTVDSHNSPITAEIEMSDGQTFTHTIGAPLGALSGIYVFDTSSVNAHLTKANSISFTPAGLTCLKGLSLVVVAMRSRLDDLIKSKRVPNTFSSQFSEPSEVSSLIATLSAESDFERLVDFSRKSVGADKLVAELETRIAQLLTDQTGPRKNQMLRELQTLKGFEEFSKRLDKLFTSDFCSQINHAIETCNDAEEALTASSLTQFQTSNLSVIGTTEWSSFVKVAKVLADHQADINQRPYPNEGDKCLLCQQDLGPVSRELLSRLWQYADGSVQKAFDDSVAKLQKFSERLDLTIAEIGLQSNAMALIAEQEPDSVEPIGLWLELALQQLKNLQAAVSCRETCLLSSFAGPLASINLLVNQRLSQIALLESQEIGSEITKLRQELTTLRHYSILNEHIAEIGKHIEVLKWIQKAESAMPTTRVITEQYNKVFNELVTEKYVATFKHYVSRFLHDSVKVVVKTRGAQGETVRQIVLETSPKSKPEKVLSEGEQRAVALADFLTEVSLDSDCTGLVFDDPVTSYGLEWREVAAQVLSEQAQSRQVLIFTHDLAFLYFLQKSASAQKIDFSSHWINRGPDGRPGFIALDNSPVLEKSYRNSEKAKKHLSRAQSIGEGEERQCFILQGFTALRTSYEALIMHDLLQGAVVRFNERVSVDAFKKIRWNPRTAKEISERFERLCFLMEGHSHSDTLNMGNPTAECLKSEIAHFDRLKAQVRDDLRNESGNFENQVSSLTILEESSELSLLKNDC